MRKIIYKFFFALSVFASAFGLDRPPAEPVIQNGKSVSAYVVETADENGKLFFADAIKSDDSILIAGHYSHRSHQSHQSHRSHYSSY